MMYLYHLAGGAVTVAAINAALPALLSGETNMPHALALLVGAGLGLLFHHADRCASGA